MPFFQYYMQYRTAVDVAHSYLHRFLHGTSIEKQHKSMYIEMNNALFSNLFVFSISEPYSTLHYFDMIRYWQFIKTKCKIPYFPR